MLEVCAVGDGMSIGEETMLHWLAVLLGAVCCEQVVVVELVD